MSRTTTQSGKAAQPTSTTTQASTTQSTVPLDKVAMRAYQKWVQAGCKHGCDKQHWFEAEAEIRAELTRSAPTQKR